MVNIVYSKFKVIFRGLSPRLFDKLSKHKLVVKYIITGVSAAVVDLTILFVVTEYLLVSRYLLGATVAFMTSFSFAFVLQKYWTFGDYSDDNIHGQFFGYFITVILSFVLNILILYSLVEFFRVYYIFGQIIALCITGVFGFVINVRSVFNRPYNKVGVLIAAGIFPPDVGGPASHVYNLARELQALRANVTIVTYSKFRTGEDCQDEPFDVIRIASNWPTLIRGFSYLVSLFIASANHTNIFAQDVTATGLPAFIVKKILPQKKFIIRMGGDLLWERETERGSIESSLVDYYNSGKHRDKILYKICKIVISSADSIVVPAEFLKRIYVRYYDIPEEKISVLPNPLPMVDRDLLPNTKFFSHDEKVILYAGRFIKLKNVQLLIRTFASVYGSIKPARLILVGSGEEKGKYLQIIENLHLGDRVTVLDSLLKKELFSLIKASSLCVCPSWTDVNPNFILECLAYEKPVLLTQNNGLSVRLPSDYLFAYNNQKELEEKMVAILDGRVDIKKISPSISSETAKESQDLIVREYSKIFNF